MLLLAAESAVFVILFETQSTILWLSVYPASFALFQLVETTECELKKDVLVWIRKMSTLLYLSHGVFLIAFSKMGYGFTYFISVLCCSGALSVVIISMSKKVRILKYVY